MALAATTAEAQVDGDTAAEVALAVAEAALVVVAVASAAAARRGDGETVAMNIKRIVKHLFATEGQVKRAFPHGALKAIEKAISASESEHHGEIRFAIEGALDGEPLFKGQSSRERAVDVFSQLRVWDTRHNAGLLIYLLLADRTVEIVADRGIHDRVGTKKWEKICKSMETAFKQSNFEGGVIAGVQAVTQHLKAHFPVHGADRNELPDKPAILSRTVQQYREAHDQRPANPDSHFN